MKHNIESYSKAVQLMSMVDVQMSENLIARMDVEFDRTLEEPDHKTRAKMVKTHNRNVKEVSPLSAKIYPMQVRMTQVKTNLKFLLENACYNVSYKALAKYFAEYDFIAQTIKKESKAHANNDVVKDFLRRSTVLDTNFFEVMTDTMGVMKDNIISRMNMVPDTYNDLNIEEDSGIDIGIVKTVYKDHIKSLKEDYKKLTKVT